MSIETIWPSSDSFIKLTSVQSPKLLPWKDGSGKELCRTYKKSSTSICWAIANMSGNSLEAFVTSVIESKLDQTTMFARQDHSLDIREIPPYATLLEFLDRRAPSNRKHYHSRRWMKAFDSGSWKEKWLKALLHGQCGRNLHSLQVGQASSVWTQGIQGTLPQQKVRISEGKQTLPQLLKARTFHKSMSVYSKVQEVSEASPFVAPYTVDQPNQAKEPTMPAIE